MADEKRAASSDSSKAGVHHNDVSGVTTGVVTEE
jgi:hypothetical protein